MKSHRENAQRNGGGVSCASVWSRREFLRAGAAAAVAGTASAAHAARSKARAQAVPAPPNPKPNVIILLTDDQGYGDMSCHGNPILRTPNMDRLHAESIRLTDFHVAPMCTPTRSQLMTGMDALRNAASSVCAGRSMIRHGIPTMAEIFRDSGYRTALFGKWHLGDSYPNLPHFKGFEESVYHLGWGITSMADLWENDYFDGRFRHNGVLKQYKGYCTDVWFDLSMNWIRQRAAQNEPFFLYLPTNAPHGPHWVPQKYAEPYKGKGPAAFFGMIANIDENLGKLEECLKETGQWDNTIFIFMNDNGGTAGVKLYNAGMRGSKTQYYDGGHRAVCFIRWPAGRLRPVGDVDALTQVQDLLPTLMDLCGLKKPDNARFDGLSLAGLLRGTANLLPDRMCIVQYGQEPKKWECAVMWNKWRLVRGEELYDLKTDFGQKTHVAAQNPDVLKRMRDYYEQWWAGVEPRLDDFVPIILGADQENPVTLSAADWANVYCDNMRNLREGLNRNSQWHVYVAKDGQYEIGLRRWPKEADAPLAAGVPPFKAVAGELPEGKALPVAKARLKIGDFLDETKPVAAGDKEVRFSVALKGGTKTAMQSWLLDANDEQLCGAYFAYVTRR